MNALNPARHITAAAGNGRLGQCLPSGAGAFWLSYVLLIAALLAWLIK